MKKLPLFCLAALLGAAVSAPAQVSLEARLGRHVRAGVTLGDDFDHGHRGIRHRESVRRNPHSHGHWTTVCEQVLVPGYWSEVHVPPTYGWVSDHCGRRRWGVVAPGGCQRVWVPARYETRSRQVWVRC